MLCFDLLSLLAAMILALLDMYSDGALAAVMIPAFHVGVSTSIDGVHQPDRTRSVEASETTTIASTGCCFADACISWSLNGDGYTINGECWNKEDQRHWVKVDSSLDLDLCLLNTNGKLIPSYQGVFHDTCTNCTIQSTLLLCNCRSLGGSDAQDTKIDLNMVITQSKGVLKCFDHGGSFTAI